MNFSLSKNTINFLKPRSGLGVNIGICSSLYWAILFLTISSTTTSVANAQSIIEVGKIPFSPQQLHSMSIRPEEIRAGFYVHYANSPSGMIAEDWEDKSFPVLKSVQLFGGLHQSISLRTQCNQKSGIVDFEECQGNSCTTVGLDSGGNEKSNMRTLRGSFGTYVIESPRMLEVLKQNLKSGSGVCQLSWPSWTIKAKRISRENSASVPTHLLILQTDKELLWVDGLRRTLWNRTIWPVSRSGIFSSLEADSSGRLLFKNSQGSALWLDFKSVKGFALQNNLIRFPESGLAGVFG
ncbi:hypothetical protein EBR21_08800, partial [bacterium]|nr:hypothetical protein [bacterium]